MMDRNLFFISLFSHCSPSLLYFQDACSKQHDRFEKPNDCSLGISTYFGFASWKNFEWSFGLLAGVGATISI